jgi:hypothetical protein
MHIAHTVGQYIAGIIGTAILAALFSPLLLGSSPKVHTYKNKNII